MHFLKGFVLGVALWVAAVLVTVALWRNGDHEAALAVAGFAILVLFWLWWRLRRRRPRLRGPRRIPIPPAIRREVYARDRYTCVYCRRGGRGVRLSIDHVFPVALGGTNEIGNLVTACRACNQTKSARRFDAAGLQRFAAERRTWAGRERRHGCLVRAALYAAAAAILAAVAFLALH